MLWEQFHRMISHEPLVPSTHFSDRDEGELSMQHQRAGLTGRKQMTGLKQHFRVL